MANIYPKPASVPAADAKDKWPEDFRNVENGGGGGGADPRLDVHLIDYTAPHLYEDEGEDEDYTGLLYRLVMIDGQPYLEVVPDD